MNENQNEMELRIQDILSAFFKRWWLILIATVLGGVIAFGYSYMTYVPQYRAVAKMYVNNTQISFGSTQVSISSGDITAAQSLVNTYCEILKTRLTLEEVIRRAELGYSYEQLYSMVDCGSVNETEILYIAVTSTNPQEARAIANTIIEVLPEQISTIIDGSSVRTVDRAVDGRELSPQFTKYASIGALLGLLLSMALTFIFDVLINDTLESEEWVLNTYREEIPLLAVIPDVDDVGGRGYGRYYRSHYYKHSSKSEKKGGAK